MCATPLRIRGQTSTGSLVALSVCQAMSIAMTTVMPDPVAVELELHVVGGTSQHRR